MRTIQLTKGRAAKVDDADYPYLSQFKWHAVVSNGRAYAVRSMTVAGKKRRVQMHRELMGEPVGLVIDHMNGDSLDNRRENLRACSQSENLVNSPLTWGRGAIRCTTTGDWMARVSHASRRYFLGRYPSQQAAQRAIDCARDAMQDGEDPEAVAAAWRKTGKAARIKAALRDAPYPATENREVGQ